MLSIVFVTPEGDAGKSTLADGRLRHESCPSMFGPIAALCIRFAHQRGIRDSPNVLKERFAFLLIQCPARLHNPRAKDDPRSLLGT